MSTVVVGVEASERSEDAVAFARILAGASGCETVLVSAVPYPMPDTFRAVRTALEDGTRATLARTGEGLAAAGVARVRTVSRADVSPTHLLHEIAEHDAADLIVVGSSHLGRVGRVLPGSTGRRLLHGAPCPVAIVPAGYRERAERAIARIAVAYDATPQARAAVAGGVALARLLDAELELITVVSPELLGTPALMGGPGYDLIRSDLDAAARTHVDRIVAGLPGDVRATGRVLAGDPARELLARSHDADLLLAGSRGYGPLRAVLLGGVSARVVDDAACPVIVTPRGVPAPLARLARMPAATAGGRP